jgi:hypothetical protein
MSRAHRPEESNFPLSHFIPQLSWQVMTRERNELNTTSPLSAREVYQVLTDVALGKRIMMRSSIQSWNEIYHGLMPIEIEGWRLILFNDCDTLDYCEYCRSPDGRVGTLEVWQREGADPVELLSAWEQEQVERLLAEL